MKLVLTFVASTNGKITKGDNPDVTAWSSKEDQAYFKKTKGEYKTIIRSSTTYELAKNTLIKDGSKRYIVLTRNPEKYENEKIENIVEFTSETPEQVISRLEKEGVDKALLAAGGKLVSSFLKGKLITDFELTLEPKLFGSGTPLLSESELYVDLKLIDMEKLNDAGTVLLKYKVIY